MSIKICSHGTDNVCVHGSRGMWNRGVPRATFCVANLIFMDAHTGLFDHSGEGVEGMNNLRTTVVLLEPAPHTKNLSKRLLM